MIAPFRKVTSKYEWQGNYQGKSEEWYEKAETSIPEDPEEITLNEHTHLLNDSVMLIVREVLDEFPLPFKLQDFHLLTLYYLASLKNVILLERAKCVADLMFSYLPIPLSP